jgi:hypothetical protein
MKAENDKQHMGEHMGTSLIVNPFREGLGLEWKQTLINELVLQNVFSKKELDEHFSTFTQFIRHEGSDAFYVIDGEISGKDRIYVLGLPSYANTSLHNHAFNEKPANQPDELYYIIPGEKSGPLEIAQYRMRDHQLISLGSTLLLPGNTHEIEPEIYHQGFSGKDPAIMIVRLLGGASGNKDTLHLRKKPTPKIPLQANTFLALS